MASERLALGVREEQARSQSLFQQAGGLWPQQALPLDSKKGPRQVVCGPGACYKSHGNYGGGFKGNSPAKLMPSKYKETNQ